MIEISKNDRRIKTNPDIIEVEEFTELLEMVYLV